MATNVIEAVLTATDKSYTSTLQKAMGATDSFAKKVGRGIGFGALLRAGERAFDGIGTAVKGLVGDIDSTNAAWKSFRSNMEMIGRGTEVDKVKKELQDFAAKTVYTSADMAQTYSQLAAVGTKNTSKLVQGFGMVAAAAENPQQAMKTLSTQATQMAAKPQVAWQDFKLMLEQTPAGISQVAKAMDMTTTELVQNVQDGKVATEDFFNAIIKAADAKELQEMAKQYKTIGQAADGVRATLVNRLAPAWEKINQVGIKRMSDLMTAFAGIDADALADKVGTAVDKVDGFLDQMIQRVQQAGGLVPVLTSLGTALAGIAVAPQLGNAAKALTVFNKALFGMNAGTAALAALNPAVLFGAILVGVGLLGAAFGPQIDAIISEMTTKGPQIITSLGESITSALPTLMATGAEILTNLINAIAANIPAIITQGTNILTSLVQGVIAAIPQLIPAAFNAIGQFAIGIATALPQLITQGLQLIVALVQGISNNLPQLLTSAATALGQFIVGIAQNLPQILQAGLDILQALIRGVISGITQIPAMVKSIFGAIKDAITGNKAELETSGQEQGQALIDNVASSATANTGAVQSAGAETGASFGAGLDSSISSLSLHTSGLQSSFDTLAPAAQTAGQTAGTQFGTSVQSAVASVKVDTSGVTTSLQQAAPQAQTAGTQIGTNFANGIKSAQGQITSASIAVSNASTSSLRNGYSKAYSAGASISQGMASGMWSAVGSVRAAASAIAAAADKAIKAKAQIHSPSKVTKKSGSYIGQGLVAGILSKVKAADNAGKKIVDSMLKTMKAAVNKGNFESVGKTVSNKISNSIKNSVKTVDNAIKSATTKINTAYSDRIKNTDNNALKTKYKQQQNYMVGRLQSLQKVIDKAYDTQIKNTEKKLESLAKTYQQKYDEIIKLQEDFTKSLTNVDLFRTKNGKVVFFDFTAETNKINALSKNIEKLKNILPRGLMDEIVSMDTGDALKYTNAMLQMSTDDIKAYGKTYTAMQNEASKTSKTFYSDRVAEVKDQYVKAVDKEFKALKNNLMKAGQQAVQGWANGMKKSKNKVDAVVRSIANGIIATAKKTLKIKSPSRVFAQIGAYTGEGFIVGLDKTQRDVQASIDNVLSAADFNRQMANNRFNGSLSDEYDYNIMARYEIEVPLVVNGREFARATADDMTAVQNQKETYNNRKRGIR